jgi:hypothetical protein
MEESLIKLKNNLFETSDGVIVCDILYKKLPMLVKSSPEDVKNIYIEYAKTGPLTFHRGSSISALLNVINENDKYLANDLIGLIKSSDSSIVYWTIPCILTVLGTEGYPYVTEVVNNRNFDTGTRASAIKELSKKSKQRFDRGLPSEPGEWQESELRTDEVNQWVLNGYADGESYKIPERSPLLDNPVTEIDILASKLDKKLEKDRGADLADPSNWLVQARVEDIASISEKWVNLPKDYLYFIKNFSPLNVTIYSNKFVDYLSLYGASDLILHQEGYAYDPIHKKILTDWPEEYVVIGDDGANPFVLDLNQSDGRDTAVYFAYHGEGDWDFKLHSKSFKAFLSKIIK